MSFLISYFQGYFRRTPEKPEEPPHPLPPCRYRLDADNSATITLPDGRKLGYAEWGSPTGKAILYMHGLPGARTEIAFMESYALKLNARIIAIERPGYGLSSPRPNSTILDHIKDVEYLAHDHLKLQSYGVLGISGGGPYALACAKTLPAERLKAVSIVCGLGPPDIGYSGQNLFHWLGFTVGYKYFSPLVRWYFGRQPLARLDLSDEERLRLVQSQNSLSHSPPNPKDAVLFDDVDRLRLVLRSARESFRQGTNAVAEDGKLLCSDFGFRVEDIRKDLPVQLWYGSQDDHVPPNHGIQVAARLGENARLRMEDESHASITFNWEEQILTDLVNAI